MSSSRDTRWAALGAAIWALGGELGVETVAADIARIPLANNPVFVWAIAELKALTGVLALALVRP
jgi:hypothetical protein